MDTWSEMEQKEEGGRRSEEKKKEEVHTPIYSNKNEWNGGEKENEIVDMDFLVEWIVLRHIYIHYFLYMVCTMQ